MEIKLKTLTPIWTGGVEAGKMDRIHETGIIGSLRWWYEVIVRGLGGRVCDPSKHECGFDVKKYRESTEIDEHQRLLDSGLCEVCQMFGATGWQRRFRVLVKEDRILETQVERSIQAQRTYIDRHKNSRTPTWYFPHPARFGNFTIYVQSLTPNSQPAIIAGLLQFIAGWASLGARPQMGFGVVELDNEVDLEPFLDWSDGAAGIHSYPTLPSLKNIFFSHLKLDNAADRETFNIKYDLRRLFSSDKSLRHFIMGTVEGERVAAKVKVSRPYSDRTIRVWGWIPEEADEYGATWNRETVINAIHAHLQRHYRIESWREMSSPRDTITPNNDDAQDFLHSLLRQREVTNAA